MGLWQQADPYNISSGSCRNGFTLCENRSRLSHERCHYHRTSCQSVALKWGRNLPEDRVLDSSSTVPSKRFNSDATAPPGASGRPIFARSLLPSARTCFPSILTKEGGKQAGFLGGTLLGWPSGRHSPSSSLPICLAAHLPLMRTRYHAFDSFDGPILTLELQLKRWLKKSFRARKSVKSGSFKPQSRRADFSRPKIQLNYSHKSGEKPRENS